MSNTNREVVIFAPHADDELIGCYGVIANKDNNVRIVYTESINEERKKETNELKSLFSNIVYLDYGMESIDRYLQTSDNFILFFPDPYFEKHFAHRKLGSIGEQLARNGHNVIFYSSNMEAPYISEVSEPGKKEDALNYIYSSQKLLWSSDKRYVLFEGYCKYLFNM